MRVGSPASVSAQLARTANAAENSRKAIGPIRLTIICAVLLSTFVVIGSALFLFNLHNRIRILNERSLSTNALVLAKQIEQIFAAVEAVQTGIVEDIAPLGILDAGNNRNLLSRHDLFIKLRDKAAGMPYVGALAIIDAQGRLINFSRQWPTPNINSTDREYFKALQSNPSLTSFIGEPVLNHANGSRVVHLARKISGPNGEFSGLISAAIDLQYLQKYFGEISFEPGSGVSLFRSDGVVLARFPVDESIIGRRFPNAVSLKFIATADHAVGVSTGVMDGNIRMVAAHRVGSFPIVLGATKTAATIYAGWWQTVGYVAAMSVLTVVIIAAFAFLFVRQFRNYQALVQERAERQKAEQLRQQSLQFDVALNTMSQGLVMFDSCERVVLCNQRYLEISGLAPEFMQRGPTLREIVQARQAQGSFSRDIEEYRRELLDDMAAGNAKGLIIETGDGRSHRITNVPMAGGGWVATHEDITEQVFAKTVIEKQKFQLDAALENMSQGLCMFDAKQRLIVCNKRYAEIYGLNDEQTKPGTSLRKILEYRIAIGNAPNDHEGYINNRINEVAANKAYQVTNKLNDGRYVFVVHRPMAEGGWVATHEDVTEAKSREESFRLLFKANPMPMWVIDRETLRFLDVNEAAVAHYGYSYEQFLAMPVSNLRPAADRDRFEHHLRTLPDVQFTENIGQHCRSNGSVIDVSVLSRALSYGGRPARLAAIHDITQAMLAEHELHRTKKFLDAVIEHVPLPIIVKDVTGLETDAHDSRFTLFNRAYEELTGDSRVDLIGKTAHQLFPKERADLIVRSDNEALQSDQVVLTSEHSIVTSHNGTRLVTAKKTTIRDDNSKPQYLLTVVDDVTERRQAEQRIAYLAHNDSLTDLPNRATFIEYLAATLATASKNGEQFSVLCIDLDRFKEANDSYGHLVGDELLREAARRLRAAAAGEFIARVGGDEFTLIVKSGPQPAAAEALSECLLAAFQDDFEVEGHVLQLSLSIGAAVYPADGADAKTLMANADAALYQTKAETRGAARFFAAELGAQIRERRDLQKDLKSAVTRGEFLLHYQPQETITSNKTTGFEALVRWQCPKRGLVAPGQFIPIAEESGLIVPLGEWVLREACREAASWQQPLTIAVNISPVQFHHGDLPRLVHSILLESGLAPARLELEITEGVLIGDFSRAVSILRRLKSLGVRIAMDDFGSGYSSLSYLHSFPFDKIKIDRSFIGDLEHNHHSMAIVRAIITLGHSLDVPVLAEGVETKAQSLFLTQEGCDEVQGYLSGRPLPIENYAELVGRAVNAEGNSAAAC